MLAKIKKVSTNLKHKVKRKRTNDLPLRITNENVAVHRESTLAGGRRFKYPMQYAKHKLVYNAIIIGLIALIVLILVGWWQLYKNQSVSDFYYRVTRIMNVPVARVAGIWVPYDDYLMKLRSSLYYLEKKEQVNFNSDDGKLQKEYVKKTAMYDAIADAYAKHKAKSLNFSVSNEEVDQFILTLRQSVDGEVSLQTYNSVILDYYNLTASEYRHLTKNKLVRQKVSYALDTKANNLKEKVKSELSSNASFQEIVSKLNLESSLKLEYVESGFVPKKNNDGGLSFEASKLSKGQTLADAYEPSIKDGYYFIRHIDSNDTQINFEYIKVPLSEFKTIIDDLIKSSVKYYIKMPEEKEVNNEQ